MRNEILEPLYKAIARKKALGENVSDIEEGVAELEKIGCNTCSWYKESKCLYYDMSVSKSYYCRNWEKNE